MAYPFLDGWNCCKRTGKKFLADSRFPEENRSSGLLMLQMHESGHVITPPAAGVPDDLPERPSANP
jgi:hypothetical protein